MRSFKKIILLWSFILIQIVGFGENYTFSKLTVENGLSNNEVNTIYKDSHGFMWFGTLNGLDRFDGLEIRSYTEKFPDPIKNVFSILEDVERNLWVGTSTGLFKYDKNSNIFRSVIFDSENVSVNDIETDSDSLLYLGTNNGLYVFNIYTEEKDVIHFDQSQYEGSNHISEIFKDNHGNCWLATHFGLTRISIKDKSQSNYIYNTPESQDYNSFTSLCNIGNKIYLGTSSRGIIEFDLVSKTFSKGPDVGNNLITTIDDDNKDKLYIGTNGSGLKIFNIRTKDIISIEKQENDPHSLSSNSIYSFFLDDYDRYWIGTYSGGVNYSNRISGNFTLHPVSVNYPNVNKSIRSFYFSSDGNEYFGTRNGFVHLNEKKKMNIFRTENSESGLRSNIILSIFPYKDEILVGTYGGGISSFSPKENRIKPFTNTEVFKQGSNYAFDLDREGNLWIASFNGIYRIDSNNNNIENYNASNTGLKNNQLFGIKIDSKNRLWAGTMTGINVMQIENDSLKILELPDNLQNNFKINYIYEDQAGNIWICSEAGGLYMADENLLSVKRITQNEGLPDNSVCAIIESTPGVYWISTLKGICSFSFNNEKFNNYSISDGLPGLVFSPAAVNLTDDGQLWFGNEKGLVGFYPENVDNKIFQSNIIITNLFIAGQNIEPDGESPLVKPIEYTDSIILDYKSSNIGFRFVDLNYLSPFDNNFFTQLEGFEDDWHNSGNKSTVFYERLMPGEYTFKVKNEVSAVENTNRTKQLYIIVKKPFTRSAFFWILLSLTILTSSYFAYSYLKKLLKIRSQYKTEHSEQKKYKGSSLSEEERKKIIERLSSFMKTEKAYLNAELKLSDFSKTIGISAHNISQTINQTLDQSFSDYINEFRVKEVKKLLNNEVHRQYTLMAIAKQCGFNSKTSFYRTFKKFTGKTPVEYLDDLNS